MQEDYINFSELDAEVQKLIKESVEARKLAYCRYSNFPVGASALSESGIIYTGCNVENSAYGDSICAERTAIVKAVSSGQRSFKSMAVCANLNGNPATPCGSCRQFIVEFAVNQDIVIYLTNEKMDKIKKTSVYQLLPGYFKF